MRFLLNLFIDVLPYFEPDPILAPNTIKVKLGWLHLIRSFYKLIYFLIQKPVKNNQINNN